jgi:predicted DNA-binding transcriptional regulator AlpA
MNLSTEELLNAVEVADITRNPAETIRYWRHIGKGPRWFKVGRRVLYRRSDVDAWLAEQYDNAGSRGRGSTE